MNNHLPSCRFRSFPVISGRFRYYETPLTVLSQEHSDVVISSLTNAAPVLQCSLRIEDFRHCLGLSSIFEKAVNHMSQEHFIHRVHPGHLFVMLHEHQKNTVI